MLSCCPYIYLAIILAQGDGSSNGYIVGSVTDATTNQSINNARVVLRYKEFGINKDETRTNEVGKYQIQNVSLGKYSINIITDGYSTLQREITMFSDSLITEDFTLERIESKLGTGTSDIVENGKSPKRPIIMVSVDLIDFGSDKKNLEISIKRVGGDEILGWKVVYNPTWVVVNPMNGENDGEEDKIRVEAKRGNEFSYGQLSDVITIRSNGGDKFILVKMLNTTYNPKLYNPTEITDNSMLLTWDTLNYPEFAEYRLYRSKQPGVDETSVLVFTSSACTETRYKDNNLDASTTYYYMLSTSNSSNVTAVSNIVSNTTARRLGIWRKMSEFKNMEIITDFHIVNRNSIYLIGGNIYGKVFHWNGSQIKHIQTPDLSYGSWHFTDITADNNNNMWLVTTYETVVNGRNVSVLKFDGNDWKWIENIPVRRYYSVVSTDANDIWIGGENGIVVRYNNSFIQSNKLTNKSCCIIDIYAVGNENLYCLSDDGIVWHYSVHGWERIEIPGYDPDTKPAECITGTASGNLWIGGSGEIRHFDGISWQLVYGNGSNDKVKCLRAISKNNIWAGGEFHIDGIDVNSINFDGKLWCPVKSELSYPICRMKIYAENPWAIDEQGNLLKYVVDN
jgi:hypothetical protein